MKSLFLSLLLVAFGCVGFAQNSDNNNATQSSNGGASQSSTDLAEAHPAVASRLDHATETLKAMFDAKDAAAPSELMQRAKCVIVIPGEKKGALGIGGNYGRGFATCRGQNNGQWSAPAPVFLGGGSWGLQIGGESVDLLMLVMNDKGVQKLLTTNFKVGLDASAAAGPVGRTVEAATDVKLNSDILTYSRAKGAFAGIDINGAEVKQDDKTTKDLYGSVVSFTQILNGQVRTPAAARGFLAQVRHDFAEARASK